VHWLAFFGSLPIRTIVGRLKARATRDLNASGFSGKRPWTKNCHMQSKDSREKLQNAYNYILHHQHEGCATYAWMLLEDLLLMS
jgi:hypothetical protein